MVGKKSINRIKKNYTFVGLKKKIVKNKIQKSNLHICPGNHDIE